MCDSVVLRNVIIASQKPVPKVCKSMCLVISTEQELEESNCKEETNLKQLRAECK